MTVLASHAGRRLAAAALVLAAACADIQPRPADRCRRARNPPRRRPDAVPAPDRRRCQAEGVRRLHGAGDEGLERARHRRRHRREGQARLRQRVRLPRLRQQTPVHAGNDAAHRLELEALHGGRRGPAGRGGQAPLGRADQAVRPRHPLLQRRTRPVHHDPRHAVAQDRRDPPRRHLVQVHVHAARAVGPPALPGACRADPHDVPLQQPDVHGGRPGRGGVERTDLGEVRPAPDLRPARHDALHADDRRQPQGAGAGRAVLGAPRQHGALPAALLHGRGRHRARGSHQLQRAGPLPVGHRAAQRRRGRWQAGDPERSAPRDDGPVARDAERRARKPRMGREPEPGVRHGPMGVVVPGPPAGAPRRRPARVPLADLRSCPTTASA